jgi:hypothetical protein
MGTFGTVLYLLALVTSLGCMLLLFRAYAASGMRLLLWSALCFVGLSINNALLVLDLVVFPGPEIDLRLFRLIPALAGVLFLLYGFIWEAE